MGKRLHDISQIRKYLNGELDARAMHQLERQAQDDPFLMDALEGYQNAKADQQANLGDLASRLNMRIAEKRTRIIPFRIIGIAASLLVICSAGVWWLYQGREPVKSIVKTYSQQSGKHTSAAQTADTIANPTAQQAAKPNMAANNLAKTAVQPVTRKDKVVRQTPPAAADIQPAAAITTNKPVDNVPVNKDTASLSEVIVMNYKSAKKADTSNLLADKVANKAYNVAPQQQLQSQAPGVKVYPGNKPAELSKLLTSGNLGTLSASQLIANSTIQGKVIGQNNGLPIQGATIKVAGTSQTTKTDAAGFFSLNVDTGHTKLEIATRGYHTRQYNAGATVRDTVKTITMAPADSTDLGESIATGFTSQPKDAVDYDIPAHPQKDWGAFRRYLKINAVSADGAAGIVKLTFTVDRHGSISNIRIRKGLSAAADKKAISLVKDGPEWVGNSNKQPEIITLRIKFRKK